MRKFLLGILPFFFVSSLYAKADVNIPPGLIFKTTSTVKAPWTFLSSTTFVSPLMMINTVPYVWPSANAAGCFKNDGNGNITFGTCGGSGGGGGGSGFYLGPPWNTSVSTGMFFAGDFNVLSDGNGASTFTVKNTSGPWSASQTFNSTTTFNFPISSITVQGNAVSVGSMTAMGVITTTSSVIAQSAFVNLLTVYGALGLTAGQITFTPQGSPSSPNINWGTSNNSGPYMDSSLTLGLTSRGTRIFYGNQSGQIIFGPSFPANVNTVGTVEIVHQTGTDYTQPLLVVDSGPTSIAASGPKIPYFYVGRDTVGANVQILASSGMAVVNSSLTIRGDGAGLYMQGTSSLSASGIEVRQSSIAFQNYTAVFATGGATVGDRVIATQVNGSNIVLGFGRAQTPGAGSGSGGLTPDQGATTYILISGTQNVTGSPNFSSMTVISVSISSFMDINVGNTGNIGISSRSATLPFVFSPSTVTGTLDTSGNGSKVATLSLFDYVQRQRPNIVGAGNIAGVNAGYTFRIRDEAVDADKGFVITNLFNGVLITTNPATGPINYAAGSLGRVATFIHNFASMGSHPQQGVFQFTGNRTGNGNMAKIEALSLQLTDTATGGTVSDAFGINIMQPTMGAGSTYVGLRGGIHIATQTATSGVALSSAMSIYADGKNDTALFAGRMGVGGFITGGYAFAASTTPETYNVALSTGGHFTLSGTSPTITSCGITPAGALIAGTDNGGTIQIGGGVVTACTLVFGQPYKNIPANPTCTVSDNSGTVEPFISSRSNTQMVFGLSATLGGGEIYYHCDGIRE